MYRFTTKNDNGQVILFVVVAMVIALSLGIAVSARTLSSISRVTDTDSSTRVLAAAEGGAERMLQRPYTELQNYMTGAGGITCNSEATSAAHGLEPCVIQFTYDGADVKAVVFVTQLNDEFYRVGSFDAGEVKQLKLDTYSGNKIKFCWSSTSSPQANIAYTIISSNGADYTVSKGFIKSITGVSPSKAGTYTYSDATNVPGTPFSNYSQCSDITLPANALILRVRPINGSVEKALFAGASMPLPNQGFTIQSIGMMENNGKLIKRSVRVTKSYPYATYSFFDYAIYSDKGDISN